ncbi:helix-turn-helix domain-containing protein [Ruminococcaceae bacterium OttesenSCG-928-D13]|nr:helix-turn-helix domain-containing protein [Ruminococcaceae bacterium OttesenSCG-928-D13]
MKEQDLGEISIFGQRLRALRNSWNPPMSSQDLATELGYKSDATVRNWENPKRLDKNSEDEKKWIMPPIDKIAQIADIFSCSVDYLLGRTDVINEERLEGMSEDLSELHATLSRYGLYGDKFFNLIQKYLKTMTTAIGDTPFGKKNLFFNYFEMLTMMDEATRISLLLPKKNDVNESSNIVDVSKVVVGTANATQRIHGFHKKAQDSFAQYFKILYDMTEDAYLDIAKSDSEKNVIAAIVKAHTDPV